MKIIRIIFILSIILYSCSGKADERIKDVAKMENSNKLEYITLGGGCFWCVEAVLQNLQGVETVESGYTGGKTKNPTYQDICTGTTGHAEVVRIGFNPEIIQLEDLLEVFFATHDPTTLNRQGADAGTQYRSAIFYYSDEQKSIAENIIKFLDDEKVFNNKIVTEVTKSDVFYKAENYHQDYYNQNSNQPYCRMVIDPKIQKLRNKFKNKLKN
jgi:peptide-methionine (S)-S-oxide reductase